MFGLFPRMHHPHSLFANLQVGSIHPPFVDPSFAADSSASSFASLSDGQHTDRPGAPTGVTYSKTVQTVHSSVNGKGVSSHKMRENIEDANTMTHFTEASETKNGVCESTSMKMTATKNRKMHPTTNTITLKNIKGESKVLGTVGVGRVGQAAIAKEIRNFAQVIRTPVSGTPAKTVPATKKVANKMKRKRKRSSKKNALPTKPNTRKTPSKPKNQKNKRTQE